MGVPDGGVWANWILGDALGRLKKLPEMDEKSDGGSPKSQLRVSM